MFETIEENSNEYLFLFSKRYGSAYARGHLLEKQYLQISEIVADPPRKGLGTNLMKNIIKWAKRKTINQIWINAVKQEKRFFAKFGFKFTKFSGGTVTYVLNL